MKKECIHARHTFTVTTVQLLYTVKEKGGKPDRKPYYVPYDLGNPYKNLKSENSQNIARNRHEIVRSRIWLLESDSLLYSPS